MRDAYDRRFDVIVAARRDMPGCDGATDEDVAVAALTVAAHRSRFKAGSVLHAELDKREQAPPTAYAQPGTAPASLHLRAIRQALADHVGPLPDAVHAFVHGKSSRRQRHQRGSINGGSGGDGSGSGSDAGSLKWGPTQSTDPKWHRTGNKTPSTGTAREGRSLAGGGGGGKP